MQAAFPYATGGVSKHQLTPARRSRRLSAAAAPGSQPAAESAPQKTSDKRASKAATEQASFGSLASPAKATAAAAAAAAASTSHTAFAASSGKPESPNGIENGADEVLAAAASAAGSEALELDWDALEVRCDGHTDGIVTTIAEAKFVR